MSKVGKNNPFYGKKHSSESRLKMSIRAKERMTTFSDEERKERYDWRKGRKNTSEHNKKISTAHKGMKKPWMIKKGNSNPNWIHDRSKLKKRQVRNDPAYLYWRQQVLGRDELICKIDNDSCLGQMEIHHILPWRDFPELRYNVNNGITLCHAHHPRKRAEEKRLVPIFQELVSVSSD